MNSPKSPKAPPPPPPPATETSIDVQQAMNEETKKMRRRGGVKSTFLTEQVNPSGGNTMLG